MKSLPKITLLLLIISIFFIVVACTATSPENGETGTTTSTTTTTTLPSGLYFFGTAVHDLGEGNKSYVGFWKDLINICYPEPDTESFHTIYDNSTLLNCGARDYDSHNRACYWNSSEINYLEAIPTGDSNSSSTSSIRQFDGSVYVTGTYGYGPSVACYWKDGTRVELTGAIVNDIYVYNGTVYAFGYHNDVSNFQACYWKDGVRTTFTPAGDGRYLYRYSQDGTNLYFGCTDGYFTFDLFDDSLSFTTLPFAAHIKIVKKIGSEIYAAGTFNSGGGDWAGLWIDGTVSFNETSSSDVLDIAIVSTKTYLAGYANGVACYWEDGTKQDLTAETSTYAHTIINVE